MPTSLRGNSYYEYFSEKHSHSSSITTDPRIKLDNEHAQNRQYHRLKVYLLLMLKIVSIALILKFISRGIFMIALAWNKHFYYQYNLWIPNVLIAVCIPQSILVFYLIITMYSQKRYRKKIIIIHLITTCLIIAISIYLGVQWHNYHELPAVIYPAKNINMNYSNAFEASIYIYYFPINMISTLILLFIVTHCEETMTKWKASQPKDYIELDIVSSDSSHNYKALHMPLSGGTSEDFRYHALTDDFNDVNDLTDTNTNITFQKHIGMWTLLIVFLLILYYVQYYIKDINSKWWNTHYEYIINFWILWSIIAKFVLKYIGHEFDTMRIAVREIWVKQKSIGNSINFVAERNENKCDVSLEVILEIWLSLSYWIIFRYYLVVYPNPDFRLFILAKVTHILSELFTCCRMSRWYYHYSSKFVGYVKRQNWYKCLNAHCCIPIFYIGDDDCSYTQWFNRCSIDIGVRFIIAITTSLYVYEGLSTLFWYHETFGYTLDQYLRASYYTATSIIIEVTFYFTLYFCYKRYNINIFESCCVLYYKCGRRRIYAIAFFSMLTFYSFV